MTEIIAVQSRTVRIPLAKPVFFSTRTVAVRHYTLVRVRCSDGVTGYGLCHGGTRYGGLATAALRELLRPLVIGGDPHRTEGLWQEAYQDALLNGRAGAVMRALSALDMALWDHNARATGLPLWRYMGAFHAETVPAYASGGYYHEGMKPEDTGKEVQGYVDAGFDAVKIKIGGGTPGFDTARVAAAREALGPDGTLLLDANNAWKDLASALRALRPLMDYNPFLVEEPFGPEDVANHARLAAALPVALATGELLGGRWAHHATMTQGGVTVLQPDVAVCGGITEFRRIAAAAAASGVAVAPHSLHQIHVNLVAATPNALFAEYFPDTSISPIGLILDRETEVRDGRIVLPQTPGLGFDFNAAAVDAYAVDDWA